MDTPTWVERADLRGADLGRASVWGTQVEGANLRDTTGLGLEELFADDAAYMSGRWTEIPLSLTWVLTGSFSSFDGRSLLRATACEARAPKAMAPSRFPRALPSS